MRLYKTIIIGMAITFIAVGYVHQRVEIIKTGYTLQKNRKYLSYLVDQNSNLMYNLSKLESPRYLLASLDGEEIEFANYRARQKDNYQIAYVTSSDSETGNSFISRILDLFTLSAEARPRR